MLYGQRDRMVFTQDGNQRKKYTAPMQEWTATIYDDLDRPVISTLYKTDKSKATLQSDINTATTTTTVTVNGTSAITTWWWIAGSRYCRLIKHKTV